MGRDDIRQTLALFAVSRHGSDRPRLLVLNQYYWPGVEATANLLTELCEAFGAEHDVTVITGGAPHVRRPRGA